MGCGCKKKKKSTDTAGNNNLTTEKLESVRQKIIKLKEQGKANKKGQTTILFLFHRQLFIDMNLITQLSLLLEQSTPWTEKVFLSQEIHDLEPMIKLFGGDIHEIYKALDKRGKGRAIVEN